jgi:hypothetical protein
MSLRKDDTPAARVAALLAEDVGAVLDAVVEALAEVGSAGGDDDPAGLVALVVEKFDPLLGALGIPSPLDDLDGYGFWCGVAGVEPTVRTD